VRTSGEKVRISDEAERVQSVSCSHIRSLPGLIFLIFGEKFIIRSYNISRTTS